MILFNGESHYPDMTDGYRLYIERCKTTDKDSVLDRKQYGNAVRQFCRMLADELEQTGMTDLPCDMGTVAAVSIRKMPKYDSRSGKFGYSSVDWNRTREEGRIVKKDEDGETFGIAYIAKHTKRLASTRCFGIRANKMLFKRMKKRYNEGSLGFVLNDINNFTI